jgi:hypothetical protein
MERMNISQITTDYSICIPGLPTVRLAVKEVNYDAETGWTVETVANGSYSSPDPYYKLWAEKHV